ncbi:hypothetical protein V6N13_032988 [Hibiscus sabdariffa]
MQRINGYFAHEQYEWLIGSQYKPVELAKSDWVAIRKAPPWAIDSWVTFKKVYARCLIYEIFSGMKLGETEELRDTSIPKPLLPDYQRLLSSLPSRRLNTSKLIDNSEIFQNKLVDTVHFMEILSLKDSVERDTFFRKLPTLAEQLRCQIVLNKIFPLLTSALEYGSAAAPALNALLKTGSRLSVEEFYLKVLPTIVKLFASNDRAIRVALLQHIVQYGEPLSAQVVDDQVYPHVATGFSGTSAFLRELTLKSLLLLAPKLSQRNLSGSLLKYLSKLKSLQLEQILPYCWETLQATSIVGSKLILDNKVGLGNREIVGLRTKKQQLTYYSFLLLAYQTKEEFDNMHHALLCRSDNNSLLYHHRLHYKDKDEWLIAVEASLTVYSYFDDMRVKWRPSKRLSRFAQRSEWFKHIKGVFEELFQSTAKIWSTLIDKTSHKSIYTNCPEKCLWFTNDGKVKENYNLTRDLKSFLFHAIDKNLAYVSLRFLLGSQSFVMDASEIQWTVEPTVQKDTVLSAVLYYKRHSYKCLGDIIRFCNNAFKHCNDHLRNTGILGLHKKDIESRLSIAFPSWRLCNEDSKLLVYEYMENQSLDRWLHGNKRSPISGMNSVHHAVLDWPRRQQRDSRTPNKKATTHMQQRDETDWNEEATIHICDENTIHSYFSGKKAPYTGVVVFDGGQRNDSTFLAFQTKEESDNMHHALLCRSDNNSLLYHHRLHYKDKDKDEWLIAVEASQMVYSYFDDMRVKWRPSKRLSRFAQRSEWFKHINDDFEAIFQYTAKIWSTLIDETSHKSIYTNCPVKCLWFTNDGKVKVLPNLDQGASSSSNDIDRLQQFI